MNFPQDWPKGCPPSEAEGANGVYFRVGRYNPPAAEDFQSQAELGLAVGGDECLRVGLSMLRTLADAKHLTRLNGRLGKVIYQGNLDASHGQSKLTSSQRSPSHTTWWPFADMDRTRKAAIDLELYDSGMYKGHVSPKLREAVSTIAKNSSDGGQVVFCDSNAVHEKLARLLVEKGISREKIGIINGDVAKSAEARQRIAEAFNAGKLRVVIGNTGVMGEGLNLQKDTTDLHNLDLPWEPASLQQRTGRAVRQKNVHDSVRVHHYLAKGTFDGYRLQTVGAKKDWQDQVWHGGDRLENLEAQGQLSREELQIMMSADPDAARAAIEKDVWAKKAAYEAQQRANANEVFIKFQELKSNYHALKDKGTQSGLRLKQRRDQLRAQLNASQYFDAKEALDDSKGPAALHPVTGEVYRANDGIEIPGGLHGEVYFSDKPTKWVVKGVDARNGTLFLRPYGDSTQGTKSLSLTKIQGKVVKKFAYDAKGENLELIRGGMNVVLRRGIFSAQRSSGQPDAKEEEAVQSILDAAMSAIDKEGLWHGSESGKDSLKTEVSNALSRHSEIFQGKSEPDAKNHLADLATDLFATAYLTATGLGAGVRGLQDLVGKDDALLERHAPELQYIIKRNAMRYLDGWKGDFVPVINRTDGKIALFKDYDVRKILDARDLLLPTKANKILAVEAWKQVERQKVWRKESEYVRGRFVDKGELPNYLGLYNEHTNPWSNVITVLWGARAAKDAENEYHHEIAQAVRSAGTIFEAAELADQARKYVPGKSEKTLPREVLEARMEQALRLKDSDEALAVASHAHKLGHTDLSINTIKMVDKDPRDILGRLGDMGSFVGGGHDRYGVYSRAEWKYDPLVLQTIREHVEEHRLQDEPTPGAASRKNWGEYLDVIGAKQ